MKKKKTVFAVITVVLLVAIATSVILTTTKTVIWKNADGSILETDKFVFKGSMPTYDGETPTRPKDQEYTYRFIGWDKAIEKVSENQTYTAVYEKTLNTYTLSFSVNDENFGSVDKKDVVVKYGDKITVDGQKIYIKNGEEIVVSATPTVSTETDIYSFVGWNMPSGEYEVKGDALFIANFTKTGKQSVEITFNVVDTDMGTVNIQNLSVDKNSVLYISGNEIEINGVIITAINKPADEYFVYEFWKFGLEDGNYIISQDTTINVYFIKNENTSHKIDELNTLGWIAID